MRQLNVRAASAADIPALAALMEEAHNLSRYHDKAEIDVKETKAMFMRAIQRDGLAAAGGSHLSVAERVSPDGTLRVVHGFMLGLLERVYHVGSKLWAGDVYLYVRPGSHPRIAQMLVDEYVRWAESIPDVIEIKLSATDAIGSYRRAANLYERRGFRQCGVIYERAVVR